MSVQPPAFKQLERQLTVAVVGANFSGAVLTAAYMMLVAPAGPVDRSLALSPLSLGITIGGTVFLLWLGGWLGDRTIKGHPQWYERLRTGEAPGSVPPEVRREVLNYPLAAALTSLLMWFLAGLVFGLFGSGSLRVFLSIFLIGGILTSAVAFFAVDVLWRQAIPVYFPDGQLSTLPAFRLRIFWRLLLVFLLSSLYPIGILVMLSLDRARRMLTAADPVAVLQNLLVAEIFIVLISVGISIGMALFINRTLVGPLMEIQQAMRRVAANDLDVRVPVLSNDEVGYLGERFNDMVAGLQRGEILRNLLNLYVSPEVAREALEHGTPLGGQIAECSVLFSDIRGFTSLSEQLPADILVSLLNRYMSAMVEVIVAHGGMVNKFGGDSLLAVFGTPLNPSPDHAARAVRAALAMLASLDDFNRRQAGSGEPALQIGIGITSGPVVAGNIGGEGRIEYTVIGDTVNLASRLQTLTREAGVSLLVNETLVQSIGPSHPGLRFTELPALPIRGKRDAVKIYTISP